MGEGAILVGSTNPYDYEFIGGYYALIFAHNQENIAITGKGVIDGRGRELADNFLTQAANGFINDELKLGRVFNRPKLLYLRSCKNVTVKGIMVKNPGVWTQTYDQCENLLIDGITVNSRATWNNDGMDIVDDICENTPVIGDNGFVPEENRPVIEKMEVVTKND